MTKVRKGGLVAHTTFLLIKLDMQGATEGLGSGLLLCTPGSVIKSYMSIVIRLWH